MGGSGRNGNNHRSRRRLSRRREQVLDYASWENSEYGQKASEFFQSEGKIEKGRGGLYERPRWKAPDLSTDPIPVPNCLWCGKLIKDLSTAIADKQTGDPVHFDCVLARIYGEERLERGDTISYIGGGRFGIIHYNNPSDIRDFTIKKIFEWENTDDRSEWRHAISSHFSVV